MQKHITIFYGGVDDERQVSLQSYKTVLEELSKNDQFIIESVEVMPDETWQQDGKQINQEVVLQWTQYAWIAMHGAYGEDGTLQKILEQHNVPYNGSDSLWSRISFSKSATKEIFAKNNIKTPTWETRDITADNHEKIADELFQNFPQPCVVKPNKGGSSLGISIVESKSQLIDAIAKAHAITDTIIIEEYIAGVEATVGVVENLREHNIYKLPPVEIISEGKFFDFDAKYKGAVSEVCPANFTDELKNILQNIAAKVHKTMNLSDYSRTDFIIHPDRGIYALEVNTLPGMTKESLLPKELDVVGVSLEEFMAVVIANKK